MVAGCDKIAPGSSASKLNEWFNTACFTRSADNGASETSREWTPTLRQDGVVNFDFAIFKKTTSILTTNCGHRIPYRIL